MCEENGEQGVWKLETQPGNFMSLNSRCLAILKLAGAEKWFLKRHLDEQFLDAIRLQLRKDLHSRLRD